MTRAWKRLICRLMIGVLLFAQGALAAYACPGLSAITGSMPMAQDVGMDDGMASPVQAAADAAGDRMSDCNQMADRVDKSAPNLCSEYCHFGQQSDQTQTPTLPAVLLAALYVLPSMPEPTETIRPATSAGVLAAASPPHAILHCCFRD